MRIGDDSFPAHKIRSVSLKKSAPELDGCSAFGGVIFVVFLALIGGGILSIWIPMPFGFIIGGVLGILWVIYLVIDYRKFAAEERIKEFHDVLLALDERNAEIHIASRIPKEEAEKIRTTIEEIVARAPKGKPN